MSAQSGRIHLFSMRNVLILGKKTTNEQNVRAKFEYLLYAHGLRSLFIRQHPLYLWFERQILKKSAVPICYNKITLSIKVPPPHTHTPFFMNFFYPLIKIAHFKIYSYLLLTLSIKSANSKYIVSFPCN